MGEFQIWDSHVHIFPPEIYLNWEKYAARDKWFAQLTKKPANGKGTEEAWASAEEDTSGYNVYPSQVENVIDSHPDVLMCTVIGVKDSYRMQKVKAFVVLKPGIEATESRRQEIMDHCKARLPRYAIPRDMEFRTDLPKTLVGKVAFTVLEKEEEEKQGNPPQTPEAPAEPPREEPAAAPEKAKAARSKKSRK